MQVMAFRQNGDTSNIERVFLYKDSGATAGTEGDPITGLTNASTGLNISTIANNEATANTDTSAATSSVETVTTLGTYATPTAGFVRFREVDATNMPGLYELQWENARYAVASAIWLDVTISGVADLAPFHGRIYTNPIPANTTQVSGTAQTANDNGADINAILLDTAEIGTAGAGLTNLGASGNNWNVGKTGYALTTADWNVGKTGYSLTATTGLGAQTANITGNLSGSVGSVTGAVGSVTGHTAQTGDTYALANGATGFAAIDTVVDAIQAKTDGLAFTVAGDVDCNVQTWLGTAASALETAASVRTEMDSNSTRLATLAGGIIEGTTSGSPTTTSTNTDLTGYVTGELVGRVIVFTGGTADGQAATILTYTSTSGVVTFAALTTAPAASDPFKIV